MIILIVSFLASIVLAIRITRLAMREDAYGNKRRAQWLSWSGVLFALTAALLAWATFAETHTIRLVP